MIPLSFECERVPFPAWLGPYSPARGKHTGFRFHNGQLGTWVDNDFERSFWSVVDSSSGREIAEVVRNEWGGGRVLFLPNGYVVKPLPGEDEIGHRVLIGHITGTIVVQGPDEIVDLSDPGNLDPGDLWSGPKTIGLECVIDRDGSLTCRWYHPTSWGRDTVTECLGAPNQTLAAGFRKARPGDSGGRVRVTAHGHVIANKRGYDGTWTTRYVGHVDLRECVNWEQWVRRNDE